MGARLMAVHGIVQRDPDSDVIHVVAGGLEDHTHPAQPPQRRFNTAIAARKAGWSGSWGSPPTVTRATPKSSRKAAIFIKSQSAGNVGHATASRCPSFLSLLMLMCRSAPRLPPSKARGRTRSEAQSSPSRRAVMPFADGRLGVRARAARSGENHLKHCRHDLLTDLQPKGRAWIGQAIHPGRQHPRLRKAATPWQRHAQAHRVRPVRPDLPNADLDPEHGPVAPFEAGASVVHPRQAEGTIFAANHCYSGSHETLFSCICGPCGRVAPASALSKTP